MTFVPSIHACSKSAASAFAYAYKLFAESHKPDLSVPQCQLLPVVVRYATGAAAEMERVWLARLTCLSDESKKSQRDAEATNDSRKCLVISMFEDFAYVALILTTMHVFGGDSTCTVIHVYEYP